MGDFQSSQEGLRIEDFQSFDEGFGFLDFLDWIEDFFQTLPTTLQIIFFAPCTVSAGCQVMFVLI